MSFLKKLFGSGANDNMPEAVAEARHEGFHIISTPIREGGQFRVCALIRKEADGEMREHRLIRADICSTAQEASDIAQRKARQMIDERGDGVFD